MFYGLIEAFIMKLIKRTTFWSCSTFEMHIIVQALHSLDLNDLYISW